jgi:hypothetical protein
MERIIIHLLYPILASQQKKIFTVINPNQKKTSAVQK